MNRLAIGCSFLLSFIAATVLAWNPFAPKISFERRIPAEHNLGTDKKVVLVEMRGSGDELDHFVDALFAWQKGDTLEVVDGRSANARLADYVDRESKIKHLAERWPDADAFLGIDLRGCSSHEQSGTTTEKDKQGNKQTVTEYWVTAECNASFRILDAHSGRELASDDIRGEDESSRSKHMSSYVTSGTIAGAAADTAHRTYRSFAPRKDKQTLVLEKSAPSFKEGMNAINANQYAAGRTAWESALTSNASSAPLHLDLAEVCEVLGDRDAAKEHYEAAARLDNSEKYHRALSEFQARQKQDQALATKP